MKLTSTNKPITCYNSTLFVVWLKTCSRPLCGSRETNRTPPDHPAGSINRSINRGGWGPGRTSRQCFGGHSDGETPGSIPNPEAKPVSADGTARGTGWESRSPPNVLPATTVAPEPHRGSCGATVVLCLARYMRWGRDLRPHRLPGAHIWSAWSAPPRQGLGFGSSGPLGVESRPVPAAGRCQRSCPLRGQSRLDADGA